jgi:uncharacterized protein
MHFVVFCLDHPGMAEARRIHFEAHKTRLKSAPLQALIAGPLFEPDGTISGSFFLYDAENIEPIRNFILNDPFSTAGLWKTIEIRHFENRAGRH